MIHPWLAPLWRQVVQGESRRAHALLLSGAPGQGKRDFAESYAARVLCGQPNATGEACGECEGCRLRMSGNHPDLIRVVPEAELPEEQQSSGKTKPSTQIVVDQIRALRDKLGVTAHQNGTRVVLIDPAEAMNTNTANALLKLLEEPPPETLFLLISSAPRRLLPTIRSRCQQWFFPRPDANASSAWLQESIGEGGAALLALAGGMPLAAQRLADMQGHELRRRLINDLLGMPPNDPVMVAGDWDAWLRSKNAADAGFDLPMLIDWVHRWVWDLGALALGANARFFPDCADQMQAVVERADERALVDCYNALVQIHRAASHPLNVRLVLEDLLMRYAKAVRPTQVRAQPAR